MSLMKGVGGFGIEIINQRVERVLGGAAVLAIVVACGRSAVSVPDKSNLPRSRARGRRPDQVAVRGERHDVPGGRCAASAGTASAASARSAAAAHIRGAASAGVRSTASARIWSAAGPSSTSSPRARATATAAAEDNTLCARRHRDGERLAHGEVIVYVGIGELNRHLSAAAPGNRVFEDAVRGQGRWRAGGRGGV